METQWTQDKSIYLKERKKERKKTKRKEANRLKKIIIRHFKKEWINEKKLKGKKFLKNTHDNEKHSRKTSWTAECIELKKQLEIISLLFEFII